MVNLEGKNQNLQGTKSSKATWTILPSQIGSTSWGSSSISLLKYLVLVKCKYKKTYFQNFIWKRNERCTNSFSNMFLFEPGEARVVGEGSTTAIAAAALWRTYLALLVMNVMIIMMKYVRHYHDHHHYYFDHHCCHHHCLLCKVIIIIATAAI